MAKGQTIGKLALAAATQYLMMRDKALTCNPYKSVGLHLGTIPAPAPWILLHNLWIGVCPIMPLAVSAGRATIGESPRPERGGAGFGGAPADSWLSRPGIWPMGFS